MATFITSHDINGGTSPVLMVDVSCDYYRSGNYMVYTVYTTARLTKSGSYFNYNLYASVNGGSAQFVKSGNWKGTSVQYSNTFSGISIATNGSPTIEIYFYSTNGARVPSGRFNVTLPGVTPSAPNAPAAISIPSSIAPDKTAYISWSAASGGTNGVSGYQLAYSNNGGSSWTYIDVGGTSYNLNLNNAGFVNGSRLRCAILAYSIVNGVRYSSGWTYSSTTTTNFVAPSSPRNLVLSCLSDEPIPTAQFKGSWTIPSSGGTNGVSGYQIQWLKNGANYGSVITTSSLFNNITLNGTDFTPNDRLSYKVRAYTVGQRNNYYSSYATSQYIIIVSDKFIYVSIDGSSFEKYKMYYSSDGGSFIEVKKEKFKII